MTGWRLSNSLTCQFYVFHCDTELESLDFPWSHATCAAQLRMVHTHINRVTTKLLKAFFLLVRSISSITLAVLAPIIYVTLYVTTFFSYKISQYKNMVAIYNYGELETIPLESQPEPHPWTSMCCTTRHDEMISTARAVVCRDEAWIRKYHE